MDVAKAVADSKGGKIDFKVDKFGIIHAIIGKVSFSEENIYNNSKELLDTIIKLKPASAKGEYVTSVFMSSTMSPSINVDSSSI
jgi:large subunit ribosomal protein L1